MKQGKVILICGKICSGKSSYAEKLKQKRGAVILSCDELMLSLFPAQLGDKHDKIAEKARDYLLRLASELLRGGAEVILDWGFWTRESRRDAEEFFRSQGFKTEWHYVKVEVEEWRRRIEKRNAESPAGTYFVDEGLLEKCAGRFEEPGLEEVDFIV